MIDQQYTEWLKGLGPSQLYQEEKNLYSVITTESISNEAKKSAARKLNLLKPFLKNDSDK